jgi:hypothetical protein
MKACHTATPMATLKVEQNDLGGLVRSHQVDDASVTVASWAQRCRVHSDPTMRRGLSESVLATGCSKRGPDENPGLTFSLQMRG